MLYDCTLMEKKIKMKNGKILDEKPLAHLNTSSRFAKT